MRGATATNPWTEGTNFVSWFDRAALGSHRWVEGPTGYDTEGLLSTLPALAQCLLGVLAGRWLASHAMKAADLCIACLFTLVIWCPLAVIYSRGARVSI
jgi:predicted acyltransferase